MDDMNTSKKKQDFQEKLLAYNIDIRLSTNQGKAEEVFKSILKRDAYQPFLHKALKKQHYLEIVSFWIVNCVPDDAFAELNKVLRDCQLEEYCLSAYKFDHITPFYALQDNKTLSYEHRDKIYDRITRECILQARYIGLFLLSCQDYAVIYEQNSNHKELIDAIMQEVRENYSPSWACLKALFTYIGREKFVEKIEREILSEGDMGSSVNVSLVVNKEESMEAGYESQLVRRDPNVLVYTCCKDVYQKVTLTGEQLPKEVTLVRGGKTVPLPMNFDEYMKKCEIFLNEYFKIDMNNINRISKKIHFPPSYMINDRVSKLADQFHIDHTVIVTHYDVIEHCKLFKLNLDEISKNFQIDLGLVGNGDKEIILCNYELNYLCVLHYSEAHDEMHALKDLEVGESYFRLFFYLLSCILGKDFSYMSVVAAPKMSADCENPLILAESDVAAISERLKSLGCNRSINTPIIDRKESFEKCLMFLSLLLAFVATTQVCFNVLSESVAEKVLSVWLTTEQLEVVLSDNFWKIVVGGYGSGKTLIARYLLKHLMKYSNMATDIYFVLFDNSSLLMKSMEDYCKDLRMQFKKDGRNLICHNALGIGEFLKYEIEELFPDSSGSIDFTISNMLLAIKQRSQKASRRFHLIVDEVDAEVINEVEAANLKKIFSDDRDAMKESHILFVLRSMEKKRVYISEGTSYIHKSYQYYRDCGMKLVELTYSMRVTMQVYEIMKICMDGITSPTVVPHAGGDLERQSKQTNLTNIASSSPSYKEKPRKLTNVASLEEELSNADSGSSSSSIKVNDNGEQHNNISFPPLMGSKTHSVVLSHDDPNTIDHFAKVCEQKYQGSANKLETLYFFQKSKFCQHRIHGHKPELIFLNLDGDNELAKIEIMSLLSVALTKVFLSKATINGGKRLIVCSNKEEIDLCKSIKTFNKQTTCFHEAENSTHIDHFQRFDTIITTYEGSRGLEFPLVIVIINPDDYFKRQYFIEMISRCTDHLVLIVPYCYKISKVLSNERETVRNMLEKLIYFKNPKIVINITSYKLDGGMDSEAPLKNSSHMSFKYSTDGVDKNLMLTEIKINKNNEEYYQLKCCKEYNSPEVNEYNDVSLSNYVLPMPATNGTVKRISSRKVKFLWNHPGNHFRLELSTQSGASISIVNRYQRHSFEITTDNFSTYTLIVYAICKFGGLSSDALKMSYMPNEQRAESSHDSQDLTDNEGIYSQILTK